MWARILVPAAATGAPAASGLGPTSLAAFGGLSHVRSDCWESGSGSLSLSGSLGFQVSLWSMYLGKFVALSYLPDLLGGCGGHSLVGSRYRSNSGRNSGGLP